MRTIQELLDRIVPFVIVPYEGVPEEGVQDEEVLVIEE